MSFFSIFAPAKHIDRLPDKQIDPEYKKLRMQVFWGTFIGYATFYLLRKNFSLAMPYMTAETGFSKAELGIVLTGVSIAYGISKFVMGNISDRSNPKYFATAGLLLSAFISLMFGLLPGVMSSIPIMFVLSFLNGWFQGMGYPPYARTMVHWFSTNERGQKWSWWNVSHNLGGGLIAPLAGLGIFLFGTWHSIFFFPAIIAIFLAILTFFLMKDTPQSCGLPSIEEYRNDYPKEATSEVIERELTSKEILFKYVLNNRVLWYIAVANIFVYFIRYGVVDWAPTYLTEVKDFSHKSSRTAYFLYEWAGIPGMLVSGYLSDKVFKGRRAPATILFMVGVLIAIFVYWKNPAGNPLIDNIALVAIGFLIYGPVMMIGLHAADLVPKKATGSATGLTGLLGYLIGSAFAGVVLGGVVDHFGWDGGFYTLIASCLFAIILLFMSMLGKKSHTH
ncbi:glycerol-3-phosphate transporter [Testudinibacter aquarius]|uniref:Glycerol-3-phosphate transporter n=1 Tax=Testudinibacter aquarius TaxID=1524974 RepID=A0A4R3YFX4_9PAST|nr:glycerol-3-phosphate transporter [Testudinibacter aquarius]TNG95557.1 glycerol-3-phosphate transporter [Pasteurellaceae bacterium UScroc12]TNG98521.1 glycerol-3-phosphate transporter [Pasteurellaceae bacterium UScroc31]TNH00291.1 glycerol-3-phosphate transporter [Pasteurellaceae bacterium USgator11]KAE9529816.1 glycerol-3-phosphate transporter [Testudinibacter aquarius]TCV89423.1 OPA family glycerol-3-phosphate transporter-like MFS transporter [Testudinibacter aquarius]